MYLFLRQKTELQYRTTGLQVTCLFIANSVLKNFIALQIKRLTTSNSFPFSHISFMLVQPALRPCPTVYTPWHHRLPNFTCFCCKMHQVTVAAGVKWKARVSRSSFSLAPQVLEERKEYYVLHMGGQQSYTVGFPFSLYACRIVSR